MTRGITTVNGKADPCGGATSVPSGSMIITGSLVLPRELRGN